jgi:hypothetical protein
VFWWNAETVLRISSATVDFKNGVPNVNIERRRRMKESIYQFVEFDMQFT